jgi:hypothetical protein
VVAPEEPVEMMAANQGWVVPTLDMPREHSLFHQEIASRFIQVEQVEMEQHRHLVPVEAPLALLQFQQTRISELLLQRLMAHTQTN